MTRSASELSHCVTARFDVAADTALAFLRDPIALGAWSLGCMNTRPDEESRGVYRGKSLFDGSETRFCIDADPERRIVDYLLGTPGEMVPRISIRVVPADVCDLEATQCYVTMTAWRPRTMDEPRWQQLCACHEAEIHLIRAQCEAAAMGDPVQPFSADGDKAQGLSGR